MQDGMVVWWYGGTVSLKRPDRHAKVEDDPATTLRIIGSLLFLGVVFLPVR